MDEHAFKGTVDKIIEFYESLGFERMDNPFRSDDHSEEPADVLRKLHRGRLVNPQHPSFDGQILTEFFNEDVWTNDIECDVCERNLLYRKTLLEWAEISHGAFKPKNIEEIWEGATGPITVRFELDSKNSEIHPKYLQDYLDLAILKPINALIAQSGRSFEWSGPDQTVRIMCITGRQKEQMIKERNFPFCERMAEMLGLYRQTPYYLNEPQS